MYDQPQKGQTRTPRATHYTSLSNGQVYKAMYNLPGYEDDNPTEWRVSTRDEIERFERGENEKKQVSAGQVDLQAPVQAGPRSLALADDDALAAQPYGVPPAGIPIGAVPPSTPAQQATEQQAVAQPYGVPPAGVPLGPVTIAPSEPGVPAQAPTPSDLPPLPAGVAVPFKP